MLLELFRKRFGRTPIGLDRHTATRGEAVFAAGRVLSAREAPPGTITGEVEGSRAGLVYRTEVRVRLHGTVMQVTSTCTCPMDSNCKHGAALLLHWLRDHDESPSSATGPFASALLSGSSVASSEAGLTEPEPVGVSGMERLQVLHWVRGLRQLRIAPAEPAASVLLYVLRRLDRRPVLHPVRYRRLEAGRWSAPEPYRGLQTQASDPPTYWDETDLQVSAMMSRCTPVQGGVVLDSPRALAVLMAIAQAGRLYAEDPPAAPGTGRPLRLAEARTVHLDWVQEPAADLDHAEVNGADSLRLGLVLDPPAQAIYTPQVGWVDPDRGEIGAVREAPLPELIQWLRNAPRVPKAAAQDVALALHAQLLARPELKPLVPALGSYPVREQAGVPRPVLGLFALGPSTGKGSRSSSGQRPPPDRLAISLSVEYAGHRLEPLRSASLGIRDAQGPVLLLCDAAAERKAWEQLADDLRALVLSEPGAGIDPEVITQPGAQRSRASSGWATLLMLPMSSMAAARVLSELAPARVSRGWGLIDESQLKVEVLQADQLAMNLVPETTGSRQRGSATPGWFRLQSGIQVEGRSIDLAPVLADVIAFGSFEAWRAVRCPQGMHWMRLEDGRLLRIEAERIEPLARVVADWSADAKDARAAADGIGMGFELDAFAAASLAALRPDLGLPAPLEPLRRISAEFESLPEVAVPPGFRPTLRPYQKTGLAWLQFIAQTGTGGVLADDMGLGKTVQVLAHLACERASGRMQHPALVVAPTSLVFNWQDEAARHAPHLRVLALHGPQRAALFERMAEVDLVVTSYALLPRDLAVYEAQPWHVVIADEAHQVKNPRTRAAQAVRALQAHHRIALTGTPLENHLGELWSVMQFAVPGLLGREEAFKTRFRQPIERHGSEPIAAERLESLTRRIRPFMLRRTKAAVLQDLPERTDIVRRIELGPAQRDLYESVRVAMDERVRQALADAGVDRSRMVVLDALLKLRQVCCDPALMDLAAAARVKESAKREALLELLEQLVFEGRKVLVFSQFTRMLDLIEKSLDDHPGLGGVARSRLDGDTTDRRGAVKTFQEGPAQIFLLSLKAGGVGLNLTAADTVIHYDPWWNPAVQAQATDRAHRMGQQRAVFVYSLIAAGSIEERILEMQARKGALSDAVLQGALDGNALTREDLLGLFDAG